MNILVLCTGNSCRSQMAEGYLRHFSAPGTSIYSAGVEVHGLNPKAVSVMLEDGIDISGQTSNHVDEYMGISFDVILTVCDHARERCPFFPSSARRIHVNFPDPALARGTDLEVLNEFRRVRDLIRSYCKSLAKDGPPPEDDPDQGLNK